MVGTLDFVHASMAFSSVGIRAQLGNGTSKPKNGRLALSIS